MYFVFPPKIFFWALDAHNQLPIREPHWTVSWVSQIEYVPQLELIFLLRTHLHFIYALPPLFNIVHSVAHTGKGDDKRRTDEKNADTIPGTFLSLGPIYNPLLSPVPSAS